MKKLLCLLILVQVVCWCQPFRSSPPFSFVDTAANIVAKACRVGQAPSFATDATAGANLYLCTSTNVWTQAGGAGGPPSGAAGGALSGTYPNPTIANITTVGSVPFVSSGGVLNQDNANFSYTSTGVLLKLNGGSTNNSAYHEQIKLTQSNEGAFTVSNLSGTCTADPWFHINANGIGFVGDGANCIPFWSIESNTALARELRADITLDAVNPGGYAELWSKSTDPTGFPMNLFLRANKDLHLQAGAKNDLTDNTGTVSIGGSTNVTIGSYPTGVGWASFGSTGVNLSGTSFQYATSGQKVLTISGDSSPKIILSASDTAGLPEFELKNSAQDWVLGGPWSSNKLIIFDVTSALIPFTVLPTSDNIGLGRGNTAPSQTVNIKDAKATTGATRFQIDLGAADTVTTVTSTNNGATSSLPGGSVPACAKYTLSNNGTNWTIAINGGTATAGIAIPAATTSRPTVLALPAKGIITGIREKTTTAWSGTGFTTMTLSVGDSVGGDSFYTLASYDMFAATGNTNFRNTSLFKSASDAGTNVQALITGNQNLNANTITGVTDIEICWVTLP